MRTDFDCCEMDEGLDDLDQANAPELDEIEEFEREYDLDFDPSAVCDDCDAQGAFDLGHTILCLACAREHLETATHYFSEAALMAAERQQMGFCNF